jgi:hypothetical protein
MKLQVEIKATINEQDPSYKTIATLGIEKAVEKFKKDLTGQGMENLEVSITEVQNDEVQPAR